MYLHKILPQVLRESDSEKVAQEFNVSSGLQWLCTKFAKQKLEQQKIAEAVKLYKKLEK